MSVTPLSTRSPTCRLTSSFKYFLVYCSYCVGVNLLLPGSCNWGACSKLAPLWLPFVRNPDQFWVLGLDIEKVRQSAREFGVHILYGEVK